MIYNTLSGCTALTATTKTDFRLKVYNLEFSFKAYNLEFNMLQAIGKEENRVKGKWGERTFSSATHIEPFKVILSRFTQK